MPKIKIDPLIAITGFQVRKPWQNGANNCGCCISDTCRQVIGCESRTGRVTLGPLEAAFAQQRPWPRTGFEYDRWGTAA
jgi:hypothetical protein